MRVYYRNKLWRIGYLAFLLVLFLFANKSARAELEIANPPAKITLNDASCYSLDSIAYKDGVFSCKETGGFPSFKLIKGKETVLISPGDKGLAAKVSCKRKHEVSIIYDYFGSSIEIRYKVLPKSVEMDFKVLSEKDYKFLCIQSKEGLVLVPRTSLHDIKSAKIIAPARQGLQVGFCEKKNIGFSSKDNPFGLWNSIDNFGGWVMNANFVSMVKDDIGIVFRPREHSCKFFYGIKSLAGEDQLFIDVPLYFRPVQTSTDGMPLLHKSLGMEVSFCGDENNDKEVNWVDVGIFYRNKYIKPCVNVDKDIKEALIGKLHVAAGYDKLLDGIKEIGYAPQIWWLTGAHVKGGECYDQNWWVFKPVGDYGDYFKFKQKALVHGARIGVHQNLDDVYQDEGWDPDEVRKMPDGELWKGGIWGGRQAYLRDINQVIKDARIYKWIDNWFSIWNVKKNDTWHYDVLAAIELTENYDANHSATKENDFSSRYDILKYVALKKGVAITSEMVTEGLHEYLSFGLHNPCYYHYSEVSPENWDVVEEIPLFPVLFLSKAYVGDLGRPVDKDTLSYAKSLLVGTKRVKWFDVISQDDARDIYFKQNLFWAQICDLSVVDINRDVNRYTTIYSDGSELVVDLDKEAFVYEKDGIAYDCFSPFNSWGYMGVWANPYDISIKGKNYVRSISEGGTNKCVFSPDGRLNIAGSYSKGNLSVLQKTSLMVCPEKMLTVELIEEKAQEDGRIKRVFKIETEEKQSVVMCWEGGADWFDGDSGARIAQGKSKLKLEVGGKATLAIVAVQGK